jgi:hypothetical protein
MDAIGFLCVSLGSSTVQLHDGLSRPDGHCRGFVCIYLFFKIKNVLVGDAHAPVQMLVSVAKMRLPVVHFCGQKD